MKFKGIIVLHNNVSHMKAGSVFQPAQIAVGIFLLVTLIIGLWAGRRVSDMKDYALANRKYSSFVLTISFIATLVDGTDIQMLPSRIFSDGIIHLFSKPGTIIGFLMFGWIVAPRLLRFKGCMTLGGVAERLLGRVAGIITGLIGFISSIFWVAVQILIMGPFGASFLGLDERVMIWLGGGILVLYASIGGVRAVTLTDILQASAIFVFVIVIFLTVVAGNGGFTTLYEKVYAQFPDKMNVTGHHYFGLKSVYLFANLFVVLLFRPSFIQRFFMAKNETEVREMLCVNAAFRSVFLLAIMFIGLGASVLFPHIHEQDVLASIAKSFFPPGVQGLFAVGICAIIMSTVDSDLSAGGLVLTHDVIRPICEMLKIKINELEIVKWVTFIFGSLAVFVAAYVGPGASIHFELKLMNISYDVLSVIVVPLFLGIMGLIPDKRSFLLGIGAALIFLIPSRFFLDLDPLANALIYILSMLANLTTFLLSHFIQNGGFFGMNYKVLEEGSVIELKVWKPKLLVGLFPRRFAKRKKEGPIGRSIKLSPSFDA